MKPSTEEQKKREDFEKILDSIDFEKILGPILIKKFGPNVISYENGEKKYHVALKK